MRPPTDREGELRPEAPSREVGSEGGSPGDVEVARTPVPATGAEATETWVPERDDTETIVRDETGKGRRSP